VAIFGDDHEAQYFLELEAGNEVFSTFFRNDRLIILFNELISSDYHPYTWQVRIFKEGQIEEMVISFTENGVPYGFARKLPETKVLSHISYNDLSSQVQLSTLLKPSSY
jgi:hypothetical protein